MVRNALHLPAVEVTVQQKVSVNVVYLARNRILTRLREELGGLID